MEDASLTEGSGDGLMRFPVRLDRASGRTVTVQYATANGTATAGTDYTRATGRLTFAAGTTVRTVEVPVTDDKVDEEDHEEFTVTLSAALNASVATAGAMAMGTIAENDDRPRLSIADGTLTEGPAKNDEQESTGSLDVQIAVKHDIAIEFSDCRRDRNLRRALSP